MHDLNDALDELRTVIPYAHSPSVRKLSKIATLLLAKNYILMQGNALEELRRLVAYLSQVAGVPLQSNGALGQNQAGAVGTGATSTSAIMTAAMAASSVASQPGGHSANLTTSVESLKLSPSSSSASPPRFEESPPMFHHESKSSHSPMSQSMSPN